MRQGSSFSEPLSPTIVSSKSGVTLASLQHEENTPLVRNLLTTTVITGPSESMATSTIDVCIRSMPQLLLGIKMTIFFIYSVVTDLKAFMLQVTGGM